MDDEDACTQNGKMEMRGPKMGVMEMHVQDGRWGDRTRDDCVGRKPDQTKSRIMKETARREHDGAYLRDPGLS